MRVVLDIDRNNALDIAKQLEQMKGIKRVTIYYRTPKGKKIEI